MSLEEAWIELEEQKPKMARVNEDVVKSKAEISNLKHQLEQERERNTKLEQYTRRENFRLLNIKESKDEDTKQVCFDRDGYWNYWCEILRFSQDGATKRSKETLT